MKKKLKKVYESDNYIALASEDGTWAELFPKKEKPKEEGTNGKDKS